MTEPRPFIGAVSDYLEHPMRKNWFEMKAEPQQPAAIAIYDDIGAYGVTAKDFIAALGSISAPVIRLSINSPGGAVFDALAMFNALRQHSAEIMVDVIGVAASAASLIAMAGDRIHMADNAFMMVHNPMSAAAGNAEDLRDLADTLDKIGASLVSIYSNRTGQTPEKIKELLDAETWLNAEEATALGFADEIGAALPVTARFDLERMPDTVRNTWAKLTPPAAALPTLPALPFRPMADFKAIENYLLSLADRKGIKLQPGIPLLSDYHAEIVAVCEAGGVPELADTAIQSAVPLAALRHVVLNFRAAQDQATEINHHIPVAAAGTLASQVWSHRRGQA